MPVTIAFETSHLVFPTLIGVVLVLLGATIAWRRRAALVGSGARIRAAGAGMDRARLAGVIGLTTVYFLAMVPVGDVWPNTGMGFLICSIPYVFLTGLLFLHDRSPRRLLPVAAMAAVAPATVWWLFVDLFYLTLP